MNGVMRRRLLLMLTLMAGSAAYAQEAPEPVTPAGRRLADFLDGMNVESLWQRGYPVNWETGEAVGPPMTTPGGHTHCSAFAAAVAERLGIYLLRPPDHGQTWLANAQERWLNGAPGGAESAAAAGWHFLGRLSDPDASVRAVSLANAGNLVLAVYFQPPRMTPAGPQTRAGHVAIVRPSERSVEAIERDGPEVIQAGMRNYLAVPLRIGFAAHKEGWETGAIEYFWHPTTYGGNP